MAWHILRKDLRLLWALAVTVAAVECGAAGLQLWVDWYSGPGRLVRIAYLLSVLSFLGMVFLTVSALHQDPVPGMRQDWLVRPIRRRDLLLAKLLFILLAVQAPALLIDVAAGLAHGMALTAVLDAALARNVAILCFFTLPAAALGAVTRSATQFLMLTLVCFVAYLAVFLVGVVLLLGIKTSLGGSGLSWMFAATWCAVALVGAP
ncbi:MAG: hypothetical protein ACREUG_08250, partial [Steroidobacteraceae bacterium]